MLIKIFNLRIITNKKRLTVVSTVFICAKFYYVSAKVMSASTQTLPSTVPTP